MAKKPEETNPFVQDLKIPAIWKLETEQEEGESRTTLSVRLMDKDIRCQIFPANMLHWFKELPSSAKDMIIWITMHIGHGSDVITITEEGYCAQMNISRATFYSAKSAITNRIIIPRVSRKNTYWVNPGYLFKGDRTKTFRANVIPENENPLDRITG